MIPFYTPGTIREMDRTSSCDLSIPGCLLMENAAAGMAGIVLSVIQANGLKGPVAVVCGKGNNGGDGFAVARHLVNAGVQVRVIPLFPPSQFTPDALLNYTILTAYQKKFNNPRIVPADNISSVARSLKGADIAVDAILGTGGAGRLSGAVLEAARALGRSKCLIVALDAPTGLDCTNGVADADTVAADITIAAGGLKSGLLVNDAREYCGTVVTAPIGTNEAKLLADHAHGWVPEPEDIANALPVKKKTANKYSAGRVLIIAGSEQYSGAAAIAAAAAFRSGAGAVIAAVPAVIPLKQARGASAELVAVRYGSNCLTPQIVTALSEEIRKADSVLIGPGLGRAPETVLAVKRLLEMLKNKPAVIDADALYAVSNGLYSRYSLKNKVLTPHFGEFSKLTGSSLSDVRKNIFEAGKHFVYSTGAVLVLKGAPAVTFTPKKGTFVNPNGNPGLAKFGSGDALAGMIAAVIAQGAPPDAAAVAAVYLHGLAADMVAKEQSEYTYTASDVIRKLPQAFRLVVNPVTGKSA